MMGGKGVVKGRGENAISIVEQKNRNAKDCYDCSKLESCADLIGVSWAVQIGGEGHMLFVLSFWATPR